MSAAAMFAAAAIVLIPAGAQDTPYASSITDRITTATATIDAYDRRAGRLYPAPLRGFAPWLCSRGARPRTLNCTTSRTTIALKSTASYRLAGGRSVSRITTRLVAR